MLPVEVEEVVVFLLTKVGLLVDSFLGEEEEEEVKDTEQCKEDEIEQQKELKEEEEVKQRKELEEVEDNEEKERSVYRI